MANEVTSETSSGEGAPVHGVPGYGGPAVRSGEERRALLAQQVAQTIATQGARVESQSDYQAVLVTGQRVNHGLHFVIGLFTFGLWWIVWILLALTGGAKRHLIQVDDYGNVRVQHL